MSKCALRGAANSTMEAANCTEPYTLVTTALSTSLGVIDIIGIVGNCLSLVALFNMRTTAMYCILRAIAVADTVMLLCHLIFQVLPDDNLRFGLKFEWLTIFIGFAYCGTSARLISTWLTVLISVERWFAVHKPLHSGNKFTVNRTVNWIIVIWIVVPIYWLPTIFIDGQKYDEQTETISNLNETWISSTSSSTTSSLQHVTTILHIGAFAPAMLIITACNVKIMRILSNTRRRWTNITANQRLEYKSTRIPIWIVVMFYVSETPSLICYILEQFKIIDMTSDTWTWTVLAAICNYLTVLTASVNIVIYFVYARQGLLAICFKNVTSYGSMILGRSSSTRASFSRKSDRLLLDRRNSTFERYDRYDRRASCRASIV